MIRRGPNPYNWTLQRPRHPLLRAALLEEAVNHLLRGQGVVVLGGRGMGKSVFLAQLESELRQRPGIFVVVFREPPPEERTLAGAIRRIAGRLGCAADVEIDVAELVSDFLRRNREYQAIALLFDELDQYAQIGGDPPLGRALFNHLETARKTLDERLMVLAAGGRGVYAIRDVVGSPFLSRATKLPLHPFSPEEITALAAPFAESGALGDELLEAVRVSSGGHPALVTYGFEALWSISAPDVATVGALYGEFAEKHDEFLRDYWHAIHAGATDGLAARVLSAVQRHPGAVPRSALPTGTEGEFGIFDALELLEAAGLIELDGKRNADPIAARPIASLLSRPAQPAQRESLAEQLAADLETVLQWLHAAAGSLFHAPHDSGGKRLVPESCLTTLLYMGLRGQGWDVALEQLQAAGRSDLRATHPHHRGAVIVEAKIWGRNDYKSIHDQVEGYRTFDVGALSTVMFCDRPPDDWISEYEVGCFTGQNVQRLSAPTCIHGHLRALSASPGALPVSHYLIHLRR